MVIIQFHGCTDYLHFLSRYRRPQLLTLFLRSLNYLVQKTCCKLVLRFEKLIQVVTRNLHIDLMVVKVLILIIMNRILFKSLSYCNVDTESLYFGIKQPQKKVYSLFLLLFHGNMEKVLKGVDAVRILVYLCMWKAL